MRKTDQFLWIVFCVFVGATSAYAQGWGILGAGKGSAMWFPLNPGQGATLRNLDHMVYDGVTKASPKLFPEKSILKQGGKKRSF